MTLNLLTARALALAAALALPASASAHVSLEKREAPVGSSYKAVFKVPHGCEGSATTAVSVEVPEGIIGVKPMPKAGWTIAIERGAYKNAYAYYHGSTLTEGVRRVTWTGGPLADEHYDEFVFSGFVAGELEAGASIPFPVTQTCEKGEVKWVEVAGPGLDPHDLKAPAPVLKLVAGQAVAHHHHAQAGSETKAGTVAINTPWARATPAGATVGAGYLKISNSGDKPDVLLGGSSDFADRFEVHEVTHKDGVASMSKLAEGLTIPAKGSVELKPGGLHLMLIGLKRPLKAGEPVKLTLNFKNAGAVTVDFAVAPVGAQSAGEHDHGNHGAGHKH